MNKKQNHKEIKVGVVGAAGNLGRQIVHALEESSLPVSQIRVFGSARSQGRAISLKTGANLPLESLTAGQLYPLNAVFISAPVDVALSCIKTVSSDHCVVIDTTGATSLLPKVPLVVPGVHTIKGAAPRTVASPSPVAIAVTHILHELHQRHTITALNLVCLYSASFQGRAGMQELMEQTKNSLMSRPSPVEVFPKSLAFNVIPQVGHLMNNGLSSEEDLLIGQIKKIIKGDYRLTLRCIAVPCFTGLSFSVSVEFAKPVEKTDIMRLWAKNPFLFLNAPSKQDLDIGSYSTPMDVSGEDFISISRLSIDPKNPTNLHIWVTCDNVRVAALNAIKILELLG